MEMKSYIATYRCFIPQVRDSSYFACLRFEATSIASARRKARAKARKTTENYADSRVKLVSVEEEN